MMFCILVQGNIGQGGHGGWGSGELGLVQVYQACKCRFGCTGAVHLHAYVREHPIIICSPPCITIMYPAG